MFWVQTAIAYAPEHTTPPLNPEIVAVIQCESGGNPSAVGDFGTSWGLAQINLPSHPEVSKEEALDPAFAINWMTG